MTSTRRPPVHKPPWRDRWKDAPVLPAAPIPGAAIATAPQPDGLRQFWVHVVTVGGRLRGYTTDNYMGAEGPACRHGVSACSGAEARRVAVAEHRADCRR